MPETAEQRPLRSPPAEDLDPGKAWRRAHGIPIVAAFDGYRALAVIAVVMFHVFQVCGVFTLAGDSAGGVLIWGLLPGGLTVFFIVSGFVLFLPTVIRDGDFGSIRSFAIGRAARILPAYWLVLLVAMILLGEFGGELPSIGEILAHLGMLQSPALLAAGPVLAGGALVGDFHLGFGVVAPVWTLSVEVTFYVVLPFIAGTYFKRPLIGLMIAAAMVIAWQLFSRHVGDIGSALGVDVSAATEARFAIDSGNQFPTWVLAVASGMTGAWAYVRLRQRVHAEVLERYARRTALAAIPVLAAVVYFAGHDAVTDPNPFNGLFARQPLAITLVYPLVVTVLMVAVALAPAWLQRPVSNRPIRGLADLSYSVYLIHFAVIWFALQELSLPQTGSLWSTLVWTALVFSVSLGYAWLSARFLERPIRAWAHGYRRRVRRASVEPAPGTE